MAINYDRESTTYSKKKNQTNQNTLQTQPTNYFHPSLTNPNINYLSTNLKAIVSLTNIKTLEAKKNIVLITILKRNTKC